MNPYIKRLIRGHLYKERSGIRFFVSEWVKKDFNLRDKYNFMFLDLTDRERFWNGVGEWIPLNTLPLDAPLHFLLEKKDSLELLANCAENP